MPLRFQKAAAKHAVAWSVLLIAVLILGSLMRLSIYAADLSSPAETDQSRTKGADVIGSETAPPEESVSDAPAETEPTYEEPSTAPSGHEGEGTFGLPTRFLSSGSTFAGTGKISFDAAYLTATEIVSEFDDSFHLSFHSPTPGVILFLFYSDTPLPAEDLIFFQIFFRSTAAEERTFTIRVSDVTVSNGEEDFSIADMTAQITVSPGLPLTTPEDSSASSAAGSSAATRPPRPDTGDFPPESDTDMTGATETAPPSSASTGTHPQTSDDVSGVETSAAEPHDGPNTITVILWIAAGVVLILLAVYTVFMLIMRKKQQASSGGDPNDTEPPEDTAKRS